MKLKVSSAALFGRLTAINRVLNTKNSFPILDCFLFDVQDQVMSITASDSETTLITSVELIQSSENARFCIKAKTIQDSLKEISDQPITLDVNLDTMEIRGEYQNGSFNIMGERADEYPAPHAIDGEFHEFQVRQNVFVSGINQTLFATADDEIRPVMTGIYFDFTPENLVFVGTDGRKLVLHGDPDILRHGAKRVADGGRDNAVEQIAGAVQQHLKVDLGDGAVKCCAILLGLGDRLLIAAPHAQRHHTGSVHQLFGRVVRQDADTLPSRFLVLLQLTPGAGGNRGKFLNQCFDTHVSALPYFLFACMASTRPCTRVSYCASLKLRGSA